MKKDLLTVSGKIIEPVQVYRKIEPRTMQELS